MFTGIVETMGKVLALEKEESNLHITLESSLSSRLQIDQSLAHNGVCLTVVHIDDGSYTVTAIRETLDKSNLGSLQLGEMVNLERALQLGDRLDGHIVQGHVDEVGNCLDIKETGGSWIFRFGYDPKSGNMTIEKGSITINGVSLTVVDSKQSEFSVAIIPYTFQNTNFSSLKVGSEVNLEFDVIGKYLKRISQGYF